MLQRARGECLAEQQTGGGDRRAGIVDLMASVEARERQIEQARCGLEDETSMLLVHVEIAARHVQWRAELLGPALDHRERLPLLPADDARHARLQDAGLLAGDLRQGFAEKGHVVDGDRRDRGQQRLVHEIGRVEPSAEARLEQQEIGGRLGEGEKGGGRGDLEQGDQLAAISGLGAGETIDEKILGDRRRAMRPGEHDPLMEIDEMRRGIDMHALAERFGDGAGEGEEGALAVGAGDMHDRRKLVLGVAESGEQPLDAPERQVDRLRVQLLQPLQQRVARRVPRAGRSAPGAVG